MLVSAAIPWDPDGSGPLPEQLVIAAGYSNHERVFMGNSANWTQLGDEFLANTPSGVSEINDFTVHNGELYAGGHFTHVGSTEIRRVARWDGNAWRPVGGGIWGTMGGVYGQTCGVYALASFDGHLWAGGIFARAGEKTNAGPFLARWDGTNWADPPIPASSAVYALQPYQGDLVWGEVSGMWRWPTGPAPRFGDANGTVTGLVVHNGELIASGVFSEIGNGVPARQLARWDGNAWHEIPNAVQSRAGWPFSYKVYGMASYHGQLVIAGDLVSAEDGVQFIAGWDGANWCNFDGGIGGTFGLKSTIAFRDKLFAGGALATAGGVPNYSLAIWTDGCAADVDDGTESGLADGSVDINDLVFFLERFEAGHLAADVDNGLGRGERDLAVEISDLVYFLQRFDVGC